MAGRGQSWHAVCTEPSMTLTVHDVQTGATAGVRPRWWPYPRRHRRGAERRHRMPRGASPKREREYQELKEEFKEEGRYKGREEEVAARIVNKQRAEKGETKEARKHNR